MGSTYGNFPFPVTFLLGGQYTGGDVSVAALYPLLAIRYGGKQSFAHEFYAPAREAIDHAAVSLTYFLELFLTGRSGL